MKNLAELTADLLAFRKARGWDEFHKPPELARALMIEAAELNRAYIWNREPDTREVANEIADIMIYALYLAEQYRLIPERIIEAKIAMNAEKYPAGDDHAAERGWRR